MLKLNTKYILILFIFVFSKISKVKSNIDLSNDNPIVFCLKSVKKFTMDEIKEYFLRIQKPESAPDYKLDEEYFSWCVEKSSKEDD